MGRKAVEPEQWQTDTIRAMWNHRHSVEDIAAKVGFSSRTVRRIAQEDGLGRKPNQHYGRWRPSLVGRVYGRLTVTKIDENNEDRARARCTCGTEYSYWISDIVCGSTRSCGCLRKETSSRTWKEKIGMRNNKIDTI